MSSMNVFIPDGDFIYFKNREVVGAPFGATDPA
jgi:hypothetical protein